MHVRDIVISEAKTGSTGAVFNQITLDDAHLILAILQLQQKNVLSPSGTKFQATKSTNLTLQTGLVSSSMVKYAIITFETSRSLPQKWSK